MRTLALALAVSFCLAGCAGTPTETDNVRQIVAAGALILLDLDAIQDGDVTQADRDQFSADVERAIGLVGVDSTTGKALSALVGEWLGGRLDDNAWRSVARVLLNWVGGAPATSGARRARV